MTDNISMFRTRVREVVSGHYFVPGCTLIAFILRLTWIYLVNGAQIADYGVYLQRGISIANGQGYSFNGHPTAYAPIGYPGFLGALFYIVGPSVFLAKLANVLFSVGTAFLIYVLS